MERREYRDLNIYTKSKGRMKINFTVINMGKDLCVAVYGGELPHLGACALAQCRPSLSDAEKTSASVSVLTLLGHKEDKLAASIAELLASKLKVNVAVLCGIHNDDITLEEIQNVCCLADEWCAEYLKANV